MELSPDSALEILQRLARIEQKLDDVARLEREHDQNCWIAHGDHEHRLRGLERWRNLLAGAVTTLGGGVAHLFR